MKVVTQDKYGRRTPWKSVKELRKWCAKRWPDRPAPRTLSEVNWMDQRGPKGSDSMRFEQVFLKDETQSPTEWTVLTAVPGPIGYYVGLPMDDYSIYDHFEVKRLRDLPRSLKRVKLDDCPYYVAYWAERELS